MASALSLVISIDGKKQECKRLLESISEVKADIINSFYLTLTGDDDLVGATLVDVEASVSTARSSFIEYNTRLQPLMEQLKQVKDEIKQLEERLEGLLPVLESRLESLESQCTICRSSMCIPTRVTCFRCPCNVQVCLDCVRSYLQLNKTAYTRDLVGCLYCREKCMVAMSARDCYRIDYDKIRQMDDLILQFLGENQIDDRLVQCSKCNLYLKTISELVRHKRGEGMTPCCESMRPCYGCGEMMVYKTLRGGKCARCVHL